MNFHSKSAAGYIILDPTTGAGAYMIASGENGGELVGFALTLGLFMYFGILAAAAVFAAATVGSFLLASIAVGWVALNFMSWIDGINKAQNHQQFNTNNIVASLALSLGFIPRVTFEIAAMIVFVDAWIFMLSL